MANILDYVRWRGDLTFGERPFNEVDNLILSELAYADLSGIVPDPSVPEKVPLYKAARLFREQNRRTGLPHDPAPLMALAGESARFGEIRLSGYVNRVDPARQLQFSAVVFHLPDQTAYIAFRGTDNTLVGWREDMAISYTETEAQQLAAAYLNKAGLRTERMLRVGGHSKGGNLAVYASSFCDRALRPRILSVWSNDGPGFSAAVSDTREYQSILERVTLIVPEFSLVGILLNNKSERKIVKSSAAGAQQHNPLSWQVLGSAFETVENNSPASVFMDTTMRRWLDSLDGHERENLVDAVFDAMDSTGASTLQEMKQDWQSSYAAILKAALQMDPSRRQSLAEAVRKLGAAGQDTLWDNIRSAVGSAVDQLSQLLQPQDSLPENGEKKLPDGQGES